MSKKTNRSGAAALGILLVCLTLIQPIVDVITSLQMDRGVTVTVGVILRTLTIGICALICLFVRDYKGSKACRIYAWILTGWLVIFLGYLGTQGSLGDLIENAGSTLKTVSYPYMLLAAWALYQKFGKTVPAWSISVSLLIYVAIVLLAAVTGTSMASYASSRYGFSGWFSATNELSDIIAITLPAAACWLLEFKKGKGIPAWAFSVLALVCICVVCNLIATKLVFAVAVLYFAASTVWYFVHALVSRQERGHSLGNGVISAVCICVMLVMYVQGSPLSAYISEVYVPMQDEESEIYHVSVETLQEEELEPKDEDGDIWLTEQMEANPALAKLNSLLSRRLTTMATTLQCYLDGGPEVKLLGLGYAQLDKYPHSMTYMVEMDGFSILLRHGIIGFLLYYAVYLGLIVRLTAAFLRRLKRSFSQITCCSYMFAFLMAFGTSFIAGHVLTTPNVSYFLVCETMLLICALFPQKQVEPAQTPVQA